MSRETLEHEGRFMSSGVAIAEGAPNRVSAVSDFARSAMFERTFQDGMALVEDTAAYLDGAGRQEARSLARSGALAYANCSMRLTTQLMQVASWLLVQRAVREGDMAAAEACEARYRLGTAATEDLVVDVEATEPPSDDAWSLPPGILGLMDRAQRLYERVSHLDRRMHLNEDADAANPLASHMDRLRAAFGG